MTVMTVRRIQVQQPLCRCILETGDTPRQCSCSSHVESVHSRINTQSVQCNVGVFAVFAVHSLPDDVNAKSNLTFEFCLCCRLGRKAGTIYRKPWERITDSACKISCGHNSWERHGVHSEVGTHSQTRWRSLSAEVPCCPPAECGPAAPAPPLPLRAVQAPLSGQQRGQSRPGQSLAVQHPLHHLAGRTCGDQVQWHGPQVPGEAHLGKTLLYHQFVHQ